MAEQELSTVSSLPARPQPPAGVPAAGKALWRSIVVEYPPRHFRGANLMLLEQLCRAHAFVKTCERVIARRGVLLGNRANPAIAMRQAAWAEVRACCTKLRLSISGVMRAEHASARPDPKHVMPKPWEATR